MKEQDKDRINQQGGTMKPPIICQTETIDANNPSPAVQKMVEAQRDADAAYYEPLIEQVKAEVAREIEDWLETHLYARPDRPNATMGFNDWLELKKLLSKYTGGKK